MVLSLNSLRRLVDSAPKYTTYLLIYLLILDTVKSYFLWLFINLDIGEELILDSSTFPYVIYRDVLSLYI